MNWVQFSNVVLKGILHFATAKSMSSHKNTLYTLALKNQLAFSHRILSKSGFKTRFCIGSDDLQFLDSKEHGVFKAFLKCDIPEEYVAVTGVKINGLQYSFGLVVIIYCVDFRPIFGIIIKERENLAYFVITKLNTLTYNEHFRAYEVEHSKLLQCIKWNDLYSVPPILLHVVEKKLLISYYD